MSQEMIKQLFEKFWQAGMRKVGKKNALSAFKRIITKESDPESFVENLITDINMRLTRSQFGFNGLHPATYLNGERWDDELPALEQASLMPQLLSNTPQTTRTRTLEQDLNDRSWI